MYCLKCGKDTQGSQVFCEGCLQSMNAYPVKPGTAIQLPERAAPLPEKKVPRHRRALTPREQVLQLRGTVRWLSFAIGVLFAVLCLVAAMLLHTLTQDPASANLGRNYSSTNSGTQP